MRGGELAVKIGADGEKMLSEFLRIIGWDSISQNESFECSLGKKHKGANTKSDREGHNVDGTFYYDNPLNHSDTDIILCSAKHNQDAYADKSKAYSYLKELAYSLECAPKDFEFTSNFENDGKRKVYKGLLFWVSSNRDELHTSMITEVSSKLIKEDEEEGEKVGTLRGISFDSIYMVDNQKATFIFSAIQTAKHKFPGTKIQFLFPHTGFNNRSEDLTAYGPVMPIQYVNTSLLPIVIEQNDKVSILIFCDGDFDKEDLKRIMWFVNKIGGLVSEIILHFNNYDNTDDKAIENRVKQLFQKSPLTSKIKVSRTNIYEFTTLKEEQRDHTELIDAVQSLQLSNRNRTIIDPVKLLPSEGDLDQILPFGEMMKPIVASSILSETDLKSFLIRKGIYVGSKEKQSTVPLLSTLLLSPRELNTLKFSLKAKEDRVKSVPRQTQFGSNKISIKEIAGLLSTVLEKEQINTLSLPSNCTFHAMPTIQINDDEMIIGYTLEKQNSTKDLITGKQHNEGSITIRESTSGLQTLINYTSRESYAFGNKLFKHIEEELFSQAVIAEEFYSIKFNSFDNFNRINFFLRFLNMRGEAIFSDAKLEHIVVKPDNSLEEELPFDLESLKEKVKELAISGRELESVHFFQDNYKRALLMQRVKIKYDYSYGASSGACTVDLNFKDALNHSNDEADLQFNLEVLKSSSNRGQNLENLTHELNKSFNSIIQKRFMQRHPRNNNLSIDID